ncbi:uncharacterized protein LOC102809036 [Saccoglossus kowalevskii]|uniref:Uncharacterized protein LOC102809036 n=1 Tax=Saccoglossus kowalevskii TaxID=10224 RepID=A0ABM0M874_SACKO|nr:PREDICTED: uncharacterized protein LOC102809036 [Saccoglossus kowalevskii]
MEIDLLIGADYYWSIVQDHVVRGHGPTAVKSKLGYLLSGPSKLDSISVLNATVMKILTNTSSEEQLVTKYWDLESIGISAAGENENTDERSFELYRDTKIERKGNKYIAGLPWKENHPPLPTNYSLAKKRTRSMVQHLSDEMRDIYNSIINDQLKRDFIEKVTDDDTTRGHYIPHHPVKKDSITTPIRVVYNCSAKYRDQQSLNDCLDTG